MNEELQKIDDQIKLSKYYNPQLMRKYINYMEIFAEIMQNCEYGSDKYKQSSMLFEHYRRMVLNHVVKSFPLNFHTQDVMDIKDVMKMMKND